MLAASKRAESSLAELEAVGIVGEASLLVNWWV